MNPLKLVFLILFGLIAWVTLSAEACAADEKKEKAIKEGPRPQKKIAESSAEMPVYKPPLRGAPDASVGGGTRGSGDKTPVIIALVPGHTGLTVQEQPPLYWYLSKPSSHYVEITLIDDTSIDPLLEKRIDPPVEAGMHSIRLGDTGIRLTKGKRYKWYIALVLDPELRSKDVTAEGLIKRVESPPGLQTRLTQARKAEIPNIYAESGMWYDALSSLNELIGSTPDDQVLRKKRAFLLKQVGLFLEKE